MNSLNSADFTIQKSGNNEIDVVCKSGEIFKNVFFIQLFPHSMPERFISIRFVNNTYAEEEIGIVNNLETLSDVEQALVNETIEKQNPIQTILEIVSLKTRGDTCVWTVRTNAGSRRFIVENRFEKTVLISNGLVLVTDIQNCRYKIANYLNLPQKQRLLLEKVLA